MIPDKLMEPRMKLIKALCNEKYEPKYWSAGQMMEVIHENNLSLYNKEGKDRPAKQIQNAMAEAYKKMKP